ncbi:non-classical arabinogalactan protein 30-like [Ananas comosus]|uniref:Non-classical arabinogalactan protein 30-like n=1 Tax=Ananas comosus TaxID=4615 RepID=A0A6P5G6W6_ANACO|nr:non-classical arabinogalactan protein 30-like [Ananas comosus]
MVRIMKKIAVVFALHLAAILLSVAVAGHSQICRVPAAQVVVVVVVEGVVYCQNCSFRGTWSLESAATVAAARVGVTCLGWKNQVIIRRAASTDAAGYFYAALDAAGDFYKGDPARACYVRLLASPNAACDDPTNINYGFTGAALKDEGKRAAAKLLDVMIYSAGPLAFQPASCASMQ